MKENHISKEKASAMEEYIRNSDTFLALKKRFIQNKVSHGYLFSGDVGTGKYTLALLFTQMLFCTEKNKPCGQCQGCIKVMNQTHPDVLTVSTNTSIGVDTIRQVVEKTGKYSYEGGYQVIIILNAEKMTVQGQNALLKTLEEPYENTVFLLLATDKTLLLPTILSRVQQISMGYGGENEMIDVLNRTSLKKEEVRQIAYLSRGKLGRVLSYGYDETYTQLIAEIKKKFFSVNSYLEVLETGNEYKERKNEEDILFELLEELVRIPLFVTFGNYDPSVMVGYPEKWIKMATEKKSEKFFLTLLDKIFDAREKRKSQVNWQALIEELLIYIMEENQKWQQL